MTQNRNQILTDFIGSIPYRMSFAGGWIDQPFVSQHNPTPPGSMVVVAIEPNIPFMDRCGMGTSTRKVAMQIWDGRIPEGDPAALVRELYAAENEGQPAPSGSQDMAGILYPGINRLDYDFNHQGGYFPAISNQIMTPQSPNGWSIALHAAHQPASVGIRSLDREEHLDPEWIRRLGQTGVDCFAAIVAHDAQALGFSMNECMLCWEQILPGTVRHHTITLDLIAILAHYQKHYYGAMYSGCGGGYIYVVSDEPVPGGFQVKVRTA